MTTDEHDDHDELLADLARLDPTASDAPPARGSTRHHSILERAMSTTTTTTTPTATPATTPDRQASASTRRRRPTRRTALALAAAAAVVAAIGLAVVLEPGQGATPASATDVLTSAATTTGDVSSLRAAGTSDHGDGWVTTFTSEIDGADYVSTSSRTVDGVVFEERTVLIGDQRWDSTTGGGFEQTTSPPEQNNAPFPESSEAVVKAALEGSQVTDLGTGDVRGQEATHYRIALTDRSTAALQRLTPSQLARFELEYPGQVVELDVWVADDLIRRLAVRSDFDEGGAGTTIDFYDFGADITIAPPT